MSLRVEASEIIDRPAADVFCFVGYHHVRNHPRWDPDIELEQVSEGPIGVGTVIRRRNTHSGVPVEGTMKVVEFEPDRSIGVEIHDGPKETYGWMRLEPEGRERTRLTIGGDMGGVDESMRGTITGQVERSARNIKQMIESEELEPCPA